MGGFSQTECTASGTSGVYYIYSIHIFRDTGGGFLILVIDFEKCGNITACPIWPVTFGQSVLFMTFEI